MPKSPHPPKEYPRLLQVYPNTIADGEGIRYAIYLAGCSHACPGCHNPHSWQPDQGVVLDENCLNGIIEEIKRDPLLDGITISGGDPFFNPKALLWLVKGLKAKLQLNIWCYTGYLIETLLESPELSAPLQFIDMLVDGPFIADLRDPSLKFRGSSNQRMIPKPGLLLEK